jgi:hypothetical protein
MLKKITRQLYIYIYYFYLFQIFRRDRERNEFDDVDVYVGKLFIFKLEHFAILVKEALSDHEETIWDPYKFLCDACNEYYEDEPNKQNKLRWYRGKYEYEMGLYYFWGNEINRVCFYMIQHIQQYRYKEIKIKDDPNFFYYLVSLYLQLFCLLNERDFYLDELKKTFEAACPREEFPWNYPF